jgi:hypothetical protein
MFDLGELLAKFEFWSARKIQLNKHYEFMLDISQPESMAVRILKKYPGVIIEFSKINMETENNISYNFDIIANPNLCDVESNRFKRYTSAIFRSIILNSIENAVKEKDENRNSDTFEFGEERAIHEEGAAVPKARVSNRKPRKKAVRRNKKVHPQV